MTDLAKVVAVKKLEHYGDLPLPSYATLMSAGMDLLAAIPESTKINIKPGTREIIPVGISIALPEGFEGQIRPRSGLAINHGITVINAPGTIDADYRGEIKVGLINLGESEFTITRGMRIAQMVIAQHIRASWNIMKELDATQRNEGGFGSTGR